MSKVICNVLSISNILAHNNFVPVDKKETHFLQMYNDILAG